MNGQHEKKRGLAPRLRFPEFREAGEWVEKTLKDACKRITNGKANSEDHEDGGTYPLFDRSEVIKRSNAFSFEGEAVILPGEGMRFQPKYFKGKFNLHQRAYALMEHRGDARFIYHALDRFKDVIARKAVQSTVLSLRLPIIEQFVVATPKEAEQQKIADCLSSIDELITLETQRLDTLKVHKKGLMQELFPAEGETLPKLRFPEFREAGEWVEKPMGDISEIRTGPFGSVLHERDYVEVGTPIITVEHLGELGIKGKDAPKVSDNDRKRLSNYILQTGDIVFSRVGSVDRSAIIGIGENGWLFSGRLLRVRINTKNDSPSFLNHLLKHEPSRIKIRNSAVGQTMPSLNTEILKNLSLHFPRLDEQQKIADCLSSLDELITAQTQKLATLKTHKKGLMQQLFPALDEGPG